MDPPYIREEQQQIEGFGSRCRRNLRYLFLGVLDWICPQEPYVIPRDKAEAALRADIQDLQEALKKSQEEMLAWKDKYYEALRFNLEIQEKLLAYRLVEEPTEEREGP